MDKNGSVEQIRKRRNVYMGQEYFDMEAIAINERRRTGRDISIADIIRKACREFKEKYWQDTGVDTQLQTQLDQEIQTVPKTV